jgi:hypothetical protein
VLVDGETSVKSLSISNNSSAGIPAGIIRNASLEKLTINAPITTNYIYESNIDELVIPSTVTEVSANLSTNNIGKITIEDSETALTTTQFKCDTKEVYLGRNVSSSTFKDMTSLEKVTISDKVTSISNSAFRGCTNLTELTIPNSVTSISYSAFYGCTGLTEVTIPNSITEISYSTFYGCTGLTEVTIPNSITEIGDYAFEYCKGITKLTFKDGDSELSIGSEAFRFDTPTDVYFGRQMDFTAVPCSAMVDFGENVTSIANGAFKDDTAIRTVVSRNATPPTTDDTFCNETYLDGVLYVPAESIEAYQTAAGWKNFWEIKSLGDFSSIDEIAVDNILETITISNGAINICTDGNVRIVAMNGTTVYSGRGDCSVNVAKGIYIVIVNGKSHKVAV